MGRPATHKKQDLINTAIELLWKNSYGSVSVDDICKAANVNKGSFYYYFKSKADLAIAALDSHYYELKPLYDEVFSPSLSPIERFEKMVAKTYEHQVGIKGKYGHVCGCPFMSLGSEMAYQEEDISRQIKDISERYERYLESALTDMVAEGLLDQNTNVKAKASAIHGFILGQLTMARILNSLEPLKDSLREGVFSLIGISVEKTDTALA